MRISDWSSDVCSSDLADEAQDDAYAGKTNRHVSQSESGPHGIEGQIAGCQFENEDRCPQKQRGAGADRKRVVSGTSVSVRVEIGGRRIIKKKNIEVC